MRYQRLWGRLIEELNRLGSAVEVDSARTRVTFPDSAGALRSVEIVMSHDEWVAMVSVVHADFAPAAERVRAAIRGLRDDERFLVYENYDLVPSATPDLLVADPEPGPGHWVTLDRDGNVVDEFRAGED